MRREIKFGCLNRRELMFRWSLPWRFCYWDDGGDHFSFWRLLSPLNWWRSVFSSYNWDFWVRWWPDATHRCYCPTGVSFDGRICIAGWGLNWFYSRFDGDVPCPCDIALDEWRREQWPEDYEEEVTP